MATTTKKRRGHLTPSMKTLLKDALKAIEGSDMEYYACRACHEKGTHAETCVAMRIYKALRRSESR